MNRRDFIKSLVAGSALVLIPTFNLNAMEKHAKKNYPKKIIKPKRLKRGDTLGIITPSSAINEKQLDKTIKNIEKLGFKYHYTENLMAHNGFLAGTDRQRADDVNAMFANEEIDGIICARGGYGVARMLHLIDYKTIKKNPKPLIGYSDVTALLQSIFINTGLVGFHGPVGRSAWTDYAIENFRAVVMEPQDKYTIELSEANQKMKDEVYRTYAITNGKAKGDLVGGNLSLLASLVGTPYEISMKDKIVFIEEVGEAPYRIDRMLTQLTQSGNLKKAEAVALGVFSGCDIDPNDENADKSFRLKEVLEDRLSELGIPVIYGLSFGHIDNNATIPIGIKAKLNVEKQTLKIMENAVR